MRKVGGEKLKKKWKIIYGIIVLITVSVLFTLFTLRGEEVEVKKLEYEDIQRSFTEEGVLKSPDERTVHAMVNAKIEEIKIEEGERVNKGDLLVVLDDSELDYQKKELEANLKRIDGEARQFEEEPGDSELKSLELSIKQAEENKKTVQTNLDRIKKLYEVGFVSKKEYEEAEQLVSEAAYNVKQQKKAIEVLEESYDPPAGSRDIIAAERSIINSQIEYIHYQKENYYHIYAPASGIVTDLKAKEGGIISPEIPMLSLFYDDDYHLKTKVLTRDIYDIFEGMEVNLILEQRDEDKEFSGWIKEIAPYAKEDLSPLGLEEERVEVTIKPEIPDNLYIAPGYKLEVEFVTEEKLDQLIVPSMTIFEYEGKDVVLVVEDNEVGIREVTTGFETRQNVVISSGLDEDDLVIINPQEDGIDVGSRISEIIIR